MCIYKSAMSIAHDPVFHDRIKHADIDHFYIKEKVEETALRIGCVSSTEQSDNIFTKGLPTMKFSRLISKLGMKSQENMTI